MITTWYHNLEDQDFVIPSFTKSAIHLKKVTVGGI
jgi:hypothetical protein